MDDTQFFNEFDFVRDFGTFLLNLVVNGFHVDIPNRIFWGNQSATSSEKLKGTLLNLNEIHANQPKRSTNFQFGCLTRTL